MLPVVAGVAGVAAAGVAAYRYLRRKKPSDNPSDAASVETAASTAASSPPPAVAKAPAKAQTPPAHSGAKTGLITAGIGSAVIGALAFIPVKGMPLWKTIATKAGTYAVAAPARTTGTVATHAAASKSAPVIMGETSAAAGTAAATTAGKLRSPLLTKLGKGAQFIGLFVVTGAGSVYLSGYFEQHGIKDIGSKHSDQHQRWYKAFRKNGKVFIEVEPDVGLECPVVQERQCKFPKPLTALR